MRSCDAEGFEGRCSEVRIGKNGGCVRRVFRQYIRRFWMGAVDWGGSESGVEVMAEGTPFVWWCVGGEADVDCVEMLFWMSFIVLGRIWMAFGLRIGPLKQMS